MGTATDTAAATVMTATVAIITTATTTNITITTTTTMGMPDITIVLATLVTYMAIRGCTTPILTTME